MTWVSPTQIQVTTPAVTPTVGGTGLNFIPVPPGEFTGLASWFGPWQEVNGTTSVVLYEGKVTQITATDINGHTSSYAVLQFKDAATTPTDTGIYNIFYPYFTTNSPVGKQDPFGNGKTDIASRSHDLGEWNPGVDWKAVVVVGNFSGDASGAVGIAGRQNSTGAWHVVQKQGSGYQSLNYEGAWPTSSSWAQAFAGIYAEQAGSPKKAGILGRSPSSTGNTWWKALSSGTAFTSAAAPGYPS
jgi:hypothetical protein